MDQFHRKERRVLRVRNARREYRSRRGSEEFSHHRRIFLPILVLLALSAGCGFEQSPGDMPGEEGDPASDPAMEIEAMLQASTGSWNAGDLDGFLDDYWQSEQLTFSGADGVTRGWVGLKDRYAAGYWAPGVTRDSLRFEELEVMPLGQEYALALGRYVLFRPGDTTVTTGFGYFSLVLGRIEGNWKILHDHTSASPGAEEPVVNVSDAPGGS